VTSVSVRSPAAANRSATVRTSPASGPTAKERDIVAFGVGPGGEPATHGLVVVAAVAALARRLQRVEERRVGVPTVDVVGAEAVDADDEHVR